MPSVHRAAGGLARNPVIRAPEPELGIYAAFGSDYTNFDPGPKPTRSVFTPRDLQPSEQVFRRAMVAHYLDDLGRRHRTSCQCAFQ